MKTFQQKMSWRKQLGGVFCDLILEKDVMLRRTKWFFIYFYECATGPNCHFIYFYECATGPNCQCALLNTWNIWSPLRACYTSPSLGHIWPAVDNLHWFKIWIQYRGRSNFVDCSTLTKELNKYKSWKFYYCNPLVNPLQFIKCYLIW